MDSVRDSEWLYRQALMKSRHGLFRFLRLRGELGWMALLPKDLSNTWVGRMTLCMVWINTTILPHALDYFEDFSSSPFDRGWSVYQGSRAYSWNPKLERLDVEWNSGFGNQYFSWELGGILNQKDTFSFELLLYLDTVSVGVDAEKPSTFPITFGFQNFQDARRTNFFRGTGSDSPNLVEFSYFPDAGFGATVWPAVWSGSSRLSYNGPTDFALLEIPLRKPIKVRMNYDGDRGRVRTELSDGGQVLGQAIEFKLTEDFGGFKVDSFSISSYSDDGQRPPFGGSLRATGWVDSIKLTVPNPIQPKLIIQIQRDQVVLEWIGRTGWAYQLERSVDLRRWASIGGVLNGSPQKSSFVDPFVSSGDGVFYRLIGKPSAL